MSLWDLQWGHLHGRMQGLLVREALGGSAQGQPIMGAAGRFRLPSAVHLPAVIGISCRPSPGVAMGWWQDP